MEESAADVNADGEECQFWYRSYDRGGGGGRLEHGGLEDRSGRRDVHTLLYAAAAAAEKERRID